MRVTTSKAPRTKSKPEEATPHPTQGAAPIVQQEEDAPADFLMPTPTPP